MNKPDQNLNRLLRSAAQVSEEVPSVPPFGFETRVVALWRSGVAPANGLAALLRKVALVSAVVALVAAAAAARELQQNRELQDSVTNEFAIADSAIQTEFSQ
jgi:hypothetical protein